MNNEFIDFLINKLNFNKNNVQINKLLIVLFVCFYFWQDLL